MLSTIATPSSVKPFSGTQYVAKRVPALRSGPMRASVVTCASEDRRNKLAQAVLSTAAALALVSMQRSHMSCSQSHVMWV